MLVGGNDDRCPIDKETSLEGRCFMFTINEDDCCAVGKDAVLNLTSQGTDFQLAISISILLIGST